MPGHVSHTFLRSPSSPSHTTFDLVASFVSAVDLHRDCPPSLLKALAESHPDREIWLASFYEEKWGIQDLDTYKKITLGACLTLSRYLKWPASSRHLPTSLRRRTVRILSSPLFSTSTLKSPTSMRANITRDTLGLKMGCIVSPSNHT